MFGLVVSMKGALRVITIEETKDEIRDLWVALEDERQAAEPLRQLAQHVRRRNTGSLMRMHGWID